MEHNDVVLGRSAEIDYIESQVDNILNDLKDCLTGRVVRPDFLYLKSDEHCAIHGQTLLTGKLSSYGIQVRICSDDEIPCGKKILIYDLDKQRWINRQPTL